jgi:hypothetical protein
MWLEVLEIQSRNWDVFFRCVGNRNGLCLKIWRGNDKSSPATNREQRWCAPWYKYWFAQLLPFSFSSISHNNLTLYRNTLGKYSCVCSPKSTWSFMHILRERKLCIFLAPFLKSTRVPPKALCNYKSEINQITSLFFSYLPTKPRHLNQNQNRHPIDTCLCHLNVVIKPGMFWKRPTIHSYVDPAAQDQYIKVSSRAFYATFFLLLFRLSENLKSKTRQ